MTVAVIILCCADGFTSLLTDVDGGILLICIQYLSMIFDHPPYRPILSQQVVGAMVAGTVRVLAEIFALNEAVVMLSVLLMCSNMECAH